MLTAIRKNFSDYADFFILNNPAIRELSLKKVHSLKVCEICQVLAEDIFASQHDRIISGIIGVLHDVGRFEQFLRYNTFIDQQSLDHASLGVEIIQRVGFLKELDSESQKIVLEAIAQHNKFQVKEGLDLKTLEFCYLLRDADKIDIHRVMMDNLLDKSQFVLKDAIVFGLNPKLDVSEKVKKMVEKKQAIRHSDLATVSDFIIMILAWKNDLYFEESKKLLKQYQYSENILTILREFKVNNLPVF